MTAPGRLRRSERSGHAPSPLRRCLSASTRSASRAMSARMVAIREDSSSSRARSVPVNNKFAGSGALQDSQAAIRRLKTVKPQAGHLNLDESVIKLGLQAGAMDPLHPRPRYPTRNVARPDTLLAWARRQAAIRHKDSGPWRGAHLAVLSACFAFSWSRRS
jgi:hypothetical protein